ncbi:MAG: hypothetical protein QOD33_77 [Pyrinomonadaceae bacterium]|jgi:hypothetical protein|nr:hypothetical protein [Pyrinomonadaceae bacterium]
METKPAEKPEDESPKESSNPPKLDPEWPRYEQFLAEISKRLRPAPPKPWWQKVLESGGGVAIITVLLGSLLGQMIGSYIQSSKAQYDRDLADYSKYLDQGSDTVKQLYPLVGTCISAADDLVQITMPNLNREDLPRKEAQVERAQRDQKKVKFNEADNKWREARDGLGYLMRYYHHNDDGVTRAWQEVQESTTSYMKCARTLFAGYSPDKLTPQDCNPCMVERRSILTALDSLAQAVETNRKAIGVSKLR